MTYLFVTTDSGEARELIEGVKWPRFRYRNIDVNDGERLKKSVGFSPMCSVELGDLPEREFEAIVARLVKEGLYVASYTNGTIQNITPEMCNERWTGSYRN